MKIQTPIIVTEISNTCCACPSQWEGLTSDCREIYVRFRWGHLSIRVSEPKDQSRDAGVMGERVFELDHGGQYAGSLGYQELVELTEGQFVWPESETPAKKVLWIFPFG